jgi:hypothetical protein
MISFKPRPLSVGEGVPGTDYIGCWIGPRSGVDAVAKKKIASTLLHGIELLLVTMVIKLLQSTECVQNNADVVTVLR